MLESTFHALAVVREEGVFFRKAYTEWREERKTFACTESERTAMERQLEKLEETLRRQRPNYPIERKTLSVRAAAEAERDRARHHTQR